MASTAVTPEPDMNQRLPVAPTKAAAPIPVPADPTTTPQPAPAPKPENAAAADDDDEEDSDLFDNVFVIAIGLAVLYGIYAVLRSFFTYLSTFSTFSRLFIGLAIFAAALHLVPMIVNDEGEDDSLLLPVWRKARKVLPEVAEVREYVGRTWPMTMVSAGNINGGLCAAAVYATVWHVRGWEWEGITAGCVVFWVVLAQALGREIVSCSWD